MSEHDEQVKFIKWASFQQIRIEPLKALFAIINEGDRNIQSLNYFICQGLKKGVPDMFLAYPSKGYHGLFIEMKFGNAKFNKKDQIWWRDILVKNGYKHIVPYTSTEVIVEVCNYIDRQNKAHTIESLIKAGIVDRKYL